MLSNKSTILSIALLGIAQAQLQAPCNPYTSYSGCGSGFKCSPIYGNTMQNGQCVPDTQPAICYSNKGGMCVPLSQRPGSYSDGRCYSNKSDCDQSIHNEQPSIYDCKMKNSRGQIVRYAPNGTKMMCGTANPNTVSSKYYNTCTCKNGKWNAYGSSPSLPPPLSFFSSLLSPSPLSPNPSTYPPTSRPLRGMRR